MKFSHTPPRFGRLASLGAVSAVLLATAAPVTVSAAAQSAPTDFSTFAPKANPNKDKIDYSIWDEAMKNLVISMGPSLRQTAGTPPSGFGTRRVYGHTSRYRLEGTRIMFSFLDADVIGSFGEYRRDLEATADQIDIQALSRNEQLAYWINLHNVAMVEQIANAWPVRQPREIEIDGVPLDDAKFINVEGISLSPRDIREKIVYANWQDPVVIYGFWRGEIGSPSIQREAYNADNVGRLLDRSAREFVNSLRGTQQLGKTLQVSTLYEDAAQFYFKDFEKDVRTHIAEYAKDEVSAILQETTKTEASVHEFDIADMAGGAREPTYNSIDVNGQFASFRIPRAMAGLLAQREEKFRRIIREGRTGTVTVGKFIAPGDEDEDGEVK